MAAPRTAPAGIADRVRDLLGQLTVAEKVALLPQRQAAIPRLQIAECVTGTEALHGLAWLGPATVFPQAIGLAASWNPDLVRRVGAAVGDEVRARHHQDPAGCGLNVWAPVVNPLRDPRWGRNEEGYSEDPWLTGVLATAYASGLRGDHPEFLKTAPTLKHFLAYNTEDTRITGSANLRPRVLHEYELPAFRPAVEAGAAVAVMASYNLVNGRPAHVSPLIAEHLRRWSTEELLVVSDAGAPSFLVDRQHYFPDHASGHAAALRAGIDSFTDPDHDPSVTTGRITEALARGLLTEADLDRAVSRILTLRIRLGEFDPDRDPYREIGPEVINCTAHQRLAREAAREGIVLLTHRGLLPMSPDATVAVIGPLADTVHTDWYSGTLPYAVSIRAGLAARMDTADLVWCEGADRVLLRIAGSTDYLHASDQPDGGPIRTGPAEPAGHLDLIDWGGGFWALRAAANQRHLRVHPDGTLVNDSPGPNGWVVREVFTPVEHAGQTLLRHHATGRFLAVRPDGTVGASAARLEQATRFALEVVDSGASAAAEAAAAADVAVVALGDHPMINGRETEDRADLDLPSQQQRLLRAVYAANPRTVLVITSGHPYAVGWAAEHLPAVLWSAHGGQEYGNALAEVLHGNADPAGRLTQTWYRSAGHLPDLMDYDIIANDATYLYYRDAPLYPFGHGHSYATFTYRHLTVSPDPVDSAGEVTVSVEIVNTGHRAGTEVVQVYTHQLRSHVKQPLRALRGFTRVHLLPGQRELVSIPVAAADLGFWDTSQGRWTVPSARHRVMVGRSATDIRCSALLTVNGAHLGPRSPIAIRAVDCDDYCGLTLVDESPTGGDAVLAVEPGAWLELRGVDLSRHPTRARFRVSRATPGTGSLTLRGGDPLTGPVLAEVLVPPAADRYHFTEVIAPLTGMAELAHLAEEDRMLYCGFREPGTVLSQLSLELGP